MPRPQSYFNLTDLSQSMSGYAGTILAIAGAATWGEVNKIITLGDLTEYVSQFGKPTNPTDTPVYYQLQGWFKLGKNCVFVRAQGASKYAGAEADSGVALAPMASLLSEIPELPTTGKKTALYSRFPGRHDNGNIYFQVTESDETTGLFTIVASTGVVNTGTEQAPVWVVDSANVDYEIHHVSVIKTDKDGFGQSIYFKTLLEKDSKLLRGGAAATLVAEDVPSVNVAAITLEPTYTAPSDSEICSAYDLFIPLSGSTIDIIIPGSFSATVLNKVVDVSTKRGDCFHILTPAVGSTWTVDGMKGSSGWKSTINAYNWWGTAYASLYTDVDIYNNTEVVVPAAGYIAGAFAYSDAISAVWYDPNGPIRGGQSATLKKIWSETEQDALYDANIN